MHEAYSFIGRAVAGALAEGLERFRTLVDQSPFPIWVIDPEGGVLFVNVAHCEFFGLTEAEAQGAKWHVLLHPEDSERYVGELLAALQERREFVAEARVRHASGEWLWVESQAVPRYSASGEFLGMVGCSPEITARKQGGAALLASEEKYQSLFENMAEEVHFWELVRDGAGHIKTWRLVDANPPALKTWGGRSVAEIRGKTTDEIFGPGATEHFLPVVQKIFDEGASHTYEDYFPHLDKHFRFTSVPFGDFFITTGADITAIKKANEALRLSEERFRVLFEDHGAAMLLIEPESGQILDANVAATRFYGYSREQLQAMRIQQINQLPAEEVAAERRKAASHAKGMFVFPHRLASGEIRLVEVYSSSVTLQGRLTLFSIIHDVTERRHAEEALERTRSILSEAQEIAHLGSFEYVAASRTTVWSEEEYRIYGLDPAQPAPAYDVMLADCIHPDDQALLHDTFTQAMQSGSIYELEHRILRPDGSVRWVYDRAHPHFDENRELVRYVGATLDITERKRAAETLLASEQLFRAIFDQSKVGKVQVDPESGRFLRVNEAFCQFTGYSAGELLERTFFQITHPDDRAADAADLQALREGRTTSFESEKRYLQSDGRIVWGHVSVNLVRDAAGQAKFMVGVVQDITARKEAEDALRESRRLNESLGGMLDRAEQPFGMGYADGKLGYVNPAFERLTGYTRQELKAVDWATILTPPEWREVEAEKLEELNRTGVPVRYEKEYLRKDGTRVPIELLVHLVEDDDGGQASYYSLLTDLTERKLAEQARRESEAERATQQERTRLARDLHDSVSQAIFAAALKAEALDIAAECIDDDGIGPEARQVCRLCKGALADLRAMLLELRGDRLEDVPLDQLLRQLVDAAEGRTSARIELAIHGSCTLPADVHVVFYRIAQEALNNVARHAKAENAWVDLELSEARASLEVRDDGGGFELRDFGLQHLGIRTMQERAAEVGAQLHLVSAPGEGTVVIMDWRDGVAAI